MLKALEQDHLDDKARINLGSYYTDKNYVDVVWEMISPYLKDDSVILDNACGYGNFFKHNSSHKQIGNDIDELAIKTARNNNNIEFYNTNALFSINRKKYNINKNSHLCIIGNPPYNDRTSIIKKHIKSNNIKIDEDIKTRDLGMSFLLSYNNLNADIVCVLHPLSYLIKPSNFNLLKQFTNKYKLLQAKIISSCSFSKLSKSTAFPIIIGLYKKSKKPMNYDYINNFAFEVADGNSLKINDFEDISCYLDKYPSKNKKLKKDDILFWTMRDINALKRNRTFVNQYSNNSIIIDKDKLEYYVYVDVFKSFSKHIPYYFGNCNVLIDNQLFLKYKKYFILEALNRHQNLRKYFDKFDFSKTKLVDNAKQKIVEYFKQLLGSHYVS
jgi:hypothetical protein